MRGVTYKSTKKCTRFKRVNQAVVVAILVWIYGAVYFTELVKYSRRSKRWNSLAITDEFRQSYNPDLRLQIPAGSVPDGLQDVNKGNVLEP